MYVIGSGSFIKTRWKKVFVLMLFEDKEIKFSTQKVPRHSVLHYDARDTSLL